MFFKDDYVTEWNDRQWKYFAELYTAYSFGAIVSKAKRLVEPYYEEGTSLGEDEAGYIYTEITTNLGLQYL